MPEIDLMDNRGISLNAPREALLEERQRIEEYRRHLNTDDIAMVVGYDHLASTVDLVFKCDPHRQVIERVPVLDQGGFGRIYRGLGRNIGTVDGDRRTTGLLIFPKTDSRRAFEDFLRRSPPSRRIFIREGGVFLPMAAIVRDPNTPDAVPPNLVASDPGEAHQAAPSDISMLDPDTGAGIIIKAGTGRVSIVGNGVDFFRLGQTGADLLNVARAGESGGDAPTSGTAFIRSTT